jgi:hypothetical protein
MFAPTNNFTGTYINTSCNLHVRMAALHNDVTLGWRLRPDYGITLHVSCLHTHTCSRGSCYGINENTQQIFHLRFQVLRLNSMKMTALWNTAPCIDQKAVILRCSIVYYIHTNSHCWRQLLSVERMKYKRSINWCLKCNKSFETRIKSTDILFDHPQNIWSSVTNFRKELCVYQFYSVPQQLSFMSFSNRGYQ